MNKTPKEEATEMIAVFRQRCKFLGDNHFETHYVLNEQQAINCAILCVDRILKTDPQIITYEGNKYDPTQYEKHAKGNTIYWIEVKRELESRLEDKDTSPSITDWILGLETWTEVPECEIDFKKLKPTDISNSLHIFEEKYKIDGDEYRLLYPISNPNASPRIEILNKTK